MKRILAALMAAGACAPALHAQTNQGVDAAPITLDQALRAAGAASPAVEASEAGVRAAQAQRSIAGLRPNPSLETMSENVAGTGAYAGLRSSETTVSLAVPIELGASAPHASPSRTRRSAARPLTRRSHGRTCGCG